MAGCLSGKVQRKGDKGVSEESPRLRGSLRYWGKSEDKLRVDWTDPVGVVGAQLLG